ncbi:YihY/virulence factor BrkB family protein [Shimia sp. R11_0]|uniref:YihY/virulence factor BrkB family protein n=1 Tax=Shimia sp. R11_0 TaxID=2821096 RepID=UPI001ADB322C|nr:YihY/virulence factor BrkB family protein [Shimia sp. R11_0]MBO9477036.1 YihY/virulence factor BrkB family protein [Shimia sp. R11_0]
MLKSLQATVLRFLEKGGFVRSSHLALSFMFAIFPFCLFALSLAGVLSPQAKVDDLVNFAIGAWPDAISGPIESELRAVLQAGSSTVTVGALLAIIFASNGVDAIRLVITDAYRETDPRPFWKTRGLSILFVIAGSSLFVIAGGVSLIVPLALHYFDEFVPWLNQSILSNEDFRQLVTISISLFFLYACHKWLPGVKHKTGDLWPGILLCVILWWVASKAFAFYISSFSTYSVTYAGLAGIMSALVYLYLMSAIFVLGAEFNGQLMEERRRAA